jgi:phospholipase C
MIRHNFAFCLCTGLLFVSGTLLTGCQGLRSASQPPPPANPTLDNSINHIIFMVQENRSFDHYFGHLNDYRVAHGLKADVDGPPANASNPSFDGSSQVKPFHMMSMCVENPSPSWNESHVDFNLNDPTSNQATLDGFVHSGAHDAQVLAYHDVQGIRVMGYYTDADLPYYYFMATNFATSDRWFSPALTRTQPNRMYLLAATSAGHVYSPALGTPRLTNKTIFQSLEEAGVSWKIYVTDEPGNPPSALAGSHINMFEFGPQHSDKIFPVSQYLADLNNGTLPQVALIEGGYFSGRDEHPAEDPNAPGGSVQVGAQYVSGIINALMDSSSWKDSVFIWTMDEGGGFYDHVPPQPAVSPDGIPPSDLQPDDICAGGGTGVCDFNFTGYRVPMFLVSPFAKKGFVSHKVADYTAILKFIETRFHLRSLTSRDAAQPDMTEFYNFTNPPWQVPPAPPVQPTNGPCYLDHLP